jgi:hypothetical protein
MTVSPLIVTTGSIQAVLEGMGHSGSANPTVCNRGVNEKGLAYDANGLPRLDVNPHLEREPVSGGYSSYPIQILRECATVEEVITWVNTHKWHSYMWDQLHFADASGEAVIISVGADGEVAFTRKPPGDSYLVSTNFNVANPSNAVNYPCWRNETATERLEQLVSQEGELTTQEAANVLEAVHGERGGGVLYLERGTLSGRMALRNPGGKGDSARCRPRVLESLSSLRVDRLQYVRDRRVPPGGIGSFLEPRRRRRAGRLPCAGSQGGQHIDGVITAEPGERNKR